ncbi:MAG: cobalt transporter CbiM [Pirellulales bacterium]|nr:cobalt transporter CbiM [Pirellulales bacterium]
MHIAEAILPNPENPAAGLVILGAGWALTAVGTAIGLRRLDHEQIPRVAVFSAAFFVVSLIHFPIGPVSVHLVLNGLMGLLLGWAAFPALLVALLLQAVLFQYGGLTTLGINTLAMAAPAVACHYLFGPLVRGARPRTALAGAAAAGATGMLLAGLIVAAALLAAGEAFVWLSQLSLAVHAVLAVLEAAVTVAAVHFLRLVRPELLRAPLDAPRRLEVSRG